MQSLLDLPDTVGDVANNLDLWEIHWIDGGGLEIDVDHLAAGSHEKGRLFDHVVANVDDQVSGGDCPVHEVT